MRGKPAAILNTDVKGYGRQTEADELGTGHTLKANKEVMANFVRLFM
jgi:hypothetical protein